MTSPPPRTTLRALRVQLPDMPLTTLRFPDGQHTSARLQTVSLTGGLLRVLKPLNPGAGVEVMFCTIAGPVLCLAELLCPCAAARIGLQAFRFIAMPDADLETLRTAIASSQVCRSGFHGDVVQTPKPA